MYARIETKSRTKIYKRTLTIKIKCNILYVIFEVEDYCGNLKTETDYYTINKELKIFVEEN